MVVIAVFHAKPGKEKELEEAFRAMFPHVRNEPGTLAYYLQRAENKPGMFLFYEKYKDKQAFDYHCATPHFQELNKNLDGLLAEPPIVEFYAEIAAMEREKSE